MTVKPSKIYHSIQRGVINKFKAAELLEDIIENVDDDEVRKDCLVILNKFDFKNKKLFKILENLLISDLNEDIRYTAAKIIKNKFIDKALTPFIWSLQNESSFNILRSIILSFKNIADDRIKLFIIKEILRFKANGNYNDLIHDRELDNYSVEKLTDTLYGYVLVCFLQRKFKKLNYRNEDQQLSLLDFSNSDEVITYWRYAEEIQDHSELNGIKYLKSLKNIKLFPLEWAFKHESYFKCLVSLIKVLEHLDDVAKNVFTSQLSTIKEEVFQKSISDLLEKNTGIDNISNVKLVKILLNYITISFLKTKIPSLKFELKEGEVVKLEIKEKMMVTIPESMQYLTSLQELTLKKCSIYKIPEFIGSLQSLKYLNLRGNNLKEISNSICSLKGLKVLNLSYNLIKSVPSSINQIDSLEIINLEDNPLKDVYF